LSRDPRLTVGLVATAALAVGLAGGAWWQTRQLRSPYRQAADLVPLLPADRAAADRCASLLGWRERQAPVDATNFGSRRPRDASGGAVPDRPALIVLHETVVPLEATLRLFATPHPRDQDQASYHVLIARDGSVLRLVPDEGRAFGAGWSAWGDASIRHRPGTPQAGGSINNVALHVSLETPPDGRGDGDAHSGYTPAQMRSLAGQVLLFRWERFAQAWTAAAARCGVGGAYGVEAP
jgi:N-acetylmuramoyl-L-alanine amidase